MPLEIVRNDITKMHVDAIVNSVSPELRMDGGVSGAIFEAAGKDKLEAACSTFGKLAIGQAVRTDGFMLPAAHIIHTAAPVWRGKSYGEEEALRASYVNSLQLAKSLGCESVAFPLLSSGVNGYPKEKALRLAISAIHGFLINHDLLVYIVVFDQEAFSLSGKLFPSISAYIDEHYVDERESRFSRRRQAEAVFELEMRLEESIPSYKTATSLEEALAQLDESFSERLLRLIDEKGMTDAETYRKANIDRRLFSKIRNAKDYAPLKKTAIAFAIALELNFDETEDLLARAGYTLSTSSKFDVIIMYFIEQKNYNIFAINEALFSFDQSLLGG